MLRLVTDRARLARPDLLAILQVPPPVLSQDLVAVLAVVAVDTLVAVLLETVVAVLAVVQLSTYLGCIPVLWARSGEIVQCLLWYDSVSTNNFKCVRISFSVSLITCTRTHKGTNLCCLPL